MKLLVFTQKLDRADPILGFFHQWIVEFAKRCDRVTIIALQVGEYDLPQNVRVFSLGKERGSSKVSRLFYFFQLIWRERKQYDQIFVHMNPEYVVLGASFWKLLGKRILLWRNHPRGGFVIRVAMELSDRIFCTSTQSFVFGNKKTELMPIGINLNLFSPNLTVGRDFGVVLSLGRISRIKNLDLIIKAFGRLSRHHPPLAVSLRIVGEPLSSEDRDYFDELKQLVKNLGIEALVEWRPAIPNAKTVEEFNRCGVFVNATPSGSFDKSIGEAMACGALVVSSNKFLIGKVDSRLIFEENSETDLAEKLLGVMKMSTEDRRRLAQEGLQYVAKEHSLQALMDGLHL